MQAERAPTDGDNVGNVPSNVPTCVCAAYGPFASLPNNTLRGAKWSPDGLCLLTASEDHCLRLFELPEGVADPAKATAEGGASMGELAQQPELVEALSVREGDSVYDYAWYPLMDSGTPLTCCFLPLLQGNPANKMICKQSTCKTCIIFI